MQRTSYTDQSKSNVQKETTTHKESERHPQFAGETIK